ncbi:hypothetical protein Tco_0579252 [Tanacetum coccineum]
MEEIDLFLATDDSMPSGIENDDYDSEGDIRVLTTKVVKGISEHYVFMPNILPTLPTLDPDSDFTPFQDSLGSGNKIFDPEIFIEVQSETILSWDEFSISFIRDPLSPLFDTLLPFSSENEDKVFNHGGDTWQTNHLSYRYEVQRLQVQNKGSDGTGSVPGSIPDGSRMVTCHLAIGGSGL